MDRPRSIRAVLVPLALMVLVACERGETDPSPTPTTSGSTTETSTIAAPPGSYRYEGLGVAAVLTFDGATGELQVRNDTEIELGEPHLYLFAADDGTRIELTTRDARAVPPGPAEIFEVSIGADPMPPIGMVFLMLGDDDFGAFVPVGGGAA